MLTKVDIEILGIKSFGQVILEQITGDLRGAKILEIYFDDNYGNKQLNLKREKGGDFLYLLLKESVRLCNIAVDVLQINSHFWHC